MKKYRLEYNAVLGAHMVVSGSKADGTRTFTGEYYTSESEAQKVCDLENALEADCPNCPDLDTCPNWDNGECPDGEDYDYTDDHEHDERQADIDACDVGLYD